MDNTPNGLSGKTLSEPYLPTQVPTSGRSSQKWMKQGRVSQSGPCWMHNTSESPSDVEESTYCLSLILQSPQDVPVKYYLSKRAAQGVLRRVLSKGKNLPEKLQAALEAVAKEEYPPAEEKI